LKSFTEKAWVGITLFEAVGPSNRLSMANRFFDYMHSGVPQLCMAYPEYEKVNAKFELAYLIEEPNIENIAKALSKLVSDEAYHQSLQENAMRARQVYNWQEEEKRLVKVYQNLFA
jgi:glycosyltransferase involved in cell wall biosynthesis